MQENTHLLDIETPSGEEFIAWSVDMFDVNTLIDSAEEKRIHFLYNQNQFASKYGFNLCTLYNAITNMSIFLGRRLTDDEIIHLIEERIKIRFNPAVWWYQTDWTDVVGKWARSLYPEKKIIWMMIDNNSDVRKKLFTKRIPLMTTYRGNQAYNEDTHDGHLDKLSYWVSTYGHAISDFFTGNAPSWQRLDNYNNEYTIKSPEDFYTLIANWVQGRYSWVFFSQDQLSQKGQTRLKLMKLKITNGERPDDKMRRDEVAITIKRINPEAKGFWNEKNWLNAVTLSELQKMLEVGTWKKFSKPFYTEKTKNNTVTRSQTWEFIANLLGL